MKRHEHELVAAYRRRALIAATGLALAACEITGLAPDAGAQTGKTAGKATLRVVPTARKKSGKSPLKPSVAPVSGGTAGAMRSAAPPITILPNTAAVAALPAGGGSAPGGTPFSFDFRSSDINNVLKFYAQMSNLTISTDQGLSGPVTIINPKPVTLDEAFKILQSVLIVRGFTALQNGNVLTIVPLDRAKGLTTVLGPTLSDTSSENGGRRNGTRPDSRNQVMTQVIPLENVDAEALAKELTPLINPGASLIGSPGTNALILTDTASNVQRFIELVDALDKTSTNSEMKVYPLRRAEASALADNINNLYKQITSRGRGAGPQPGQPPPQPGQPSQQAGRPAVVAVADQRTNAIIVVASPDNQQQVETLISRLDGDDNNTLDTQIRKIKYASSVDVANLVNTVLSNMRGASSGGQSGGSPFQQRAFGGFGGGGGDQQSVTSSDPFGKVTADARTNSVLISASAEKMDKINTLIDEIDVDVPVETTTFVFPLKNAQADDVSYVLQQAFSTQNQRIGDTYNFGGGFGNSRGGQQRRQPIQRRLGSQNNNGRAAIPRGGRGVPPGPPNAPDDGDLLQDGATTGSAMPDGVQGLMTPEGFVPTQGANARPNSDSDEKTRQYYYGGYGGRGQQRGLGQSGGPQYGRGRTGNYSNLLQLQNNVFVAPSPNGDSLIITTTPDNYEAVKQIIEALDVVPRQVMIEVIVAEVTLDADQKLGFTLGGNFARLFSGNNSGQAGVNLPSSGTSPGIFPGIVDPVATGAQFLIKGANYSALLQALTTDNKVNVLSTPRVFTSNNAPAEIDITTNIPYITGQTNGFFTTTVSNTVEYLPVGYILNVTPRITRQGLVTIDVQQEASDLLGFDILGTGASALRAPRVNDRVTDTSVTIQDGETVVIGGLIRDSRALNISKVPVLSEIPLIGQFFRSREVTRNKVELMIFMTPHVVNNVNEARDMTALQGAPVIKQIPDLSKQQPNLDPKRVRKPYAPYTIVPVAPAPNRPALPDAPK